MAGSTGAPRRVRFWQAGFTLVELLVVIGVLLLLLGLILPAVGGAVASARLTRSANDIRQCGQLTSLYTAQFKSTYPFTPSDPFNASMNWSSPAAKAGLLASADAIDPIGVRKTGRVRYWMSVAMVYRPDRMHPGRTVPPEQAVAVPVREHQVTYPSDKGLFVQAFDATGPSVKSITWWFCCGRPQSAPVGMADGAVTIGTYLDFSRFRPVVVENNIGMPILSTWGGYLARDR